MSTGTFIQKRDNIGQHENLPIDEWAEKYVKRLNRDVTIHLQELGQPELSDDQVEAIRRMIMISFRCFLKSR